MSFCAILQPASPGVSPSRSHLKRKRQEVRMKLVKLDYQETTVSDSAYEQIAAIVKANRVCELCGNPYTPDNPNVVLNRCLNCFLRYHDNQGFTYITLYEVDQYGNE